MENLFSVQFKQNVTIRWCATACVPSFNPIMVKDNTFLFWLHNGGSGLLWPDSFNWRVNWCLMLCLWSGPLVLFGSVFSVIFAVIRHPCFILIYMLRENVLSLRTSMQPNNHVYVGNNESDWLIHGEYTWPMISGVAIKCTMSPRALR